MPPVPTGTSSTVKLMLPKMVMLIGIVLVPPRLSVTRTVRLKVPADVGVPLSNPPALSVTPGGKEPDASVQT